VQFDEYLKDRPQSRHIDGFQFVSHWFHDVHPFPVASGIRRLTEGKPFAVQDDTDGMSPRNIVN
jgi:hypothetical protein